MNAQQTRPVWISALIMCTFFTASTTAQVGREDDPELAVLVASIGRQAAMDSCRRVLEQVESEIKTGRLTITEDEEEMFPIRCAGWIGLLGDDRALPVLERILAHRRTQSRHDTEGGFLEALQRNAHASRVHLLITAGKTREVFEELMAEFERSPQRNSLPLHEQDRIDNALIALANRDEIYPMLLAYARTQYLPLSSLSAEGMEEKYLLYLDFRRIATAITPVRREGLMPLFSDADPNVRELAAELIDLSGGTVDALIRVFRAQTGAPKETTRRALESIGSALKRMIDERYNDLRNLPENSTNWRALKREVDEMQVRRDSIEAALRG